MLGIVVSNFIIKVNGVIIFLGIKFLFKNIVVFILSGIVINRVNIEFIKVFIIIGNVL